MPASSGLPGLVNLIDYEAAHRHTDHIWDETLYKRRMKVYPVLAGQIYRQLQHFLTDQTDQLSARQKAGLDPEGWMTLHLKQMREMQAEMKNLMAKGSNLALEYQRRGNEAGVSVIERPQYYIDMTRPAALLAIQRNYDVRREAVHLATTTSGYGHQEIQEFRSRPGRCFHRGSSEITQALSEEAEIQELQALSVLEINADHWLSDSVAIVTNRTREGHSLSTDDTNTDWAFLWLHDGLCAKDDAANTISAGRSVGGTILDLENQYYPIQEMAKRPSHVAMHWITGTFRVWQ